MGQWLNLTATDGAGLSAYRANPPAQPRGGLIVAQEIFGVNSHIRAVCDAFAADGYVAIAPALFDRYQRNVDIGYTPEDVARGRELKARANADAALRDIAAAREVVMSAGRVGIVGYCWGGFIAWISAARVRGLACAIAYYGTGMTEAIAEQPQCPVLAHFGERDASIPLAGVKQLATAHPEVQVNLYPAGHAFSNDQRPSYDPDAARLARDRTLAFLRQNVG
ncbi:MAG TPA: dienelactone hydrolase family protein [Casimicrobiaceae bacterium]|jgi:carboxymethylenebutenolidase|nr:dienelactone hydrolase family protein [Casimicrobiaceae bacterium]